MGKYKIEHTNTDVHKLWMLAENGVFSRRTVEKIFQNNEDGYIVFNSKESYDKYKELEYSTLAMYKM
jgi:hypothetical protein